MGDSRFASEVTDLFKYYLSSYYYGGAVVLCMSGIQAMVADKDQGRFLKFVGILAGELMALATTTDISEQMINAFVKTKLTIYDLPWYTFKKTSCQRLQLMTNMTDFRGLRTLFGYELTLAHFSDILNSSYRYYNLLYLMMKEKKIGD